MLETLGYRIKDRKFGDIKKLFSEDYGRFEFNAQDNDVVYSGAEHPFLPDITLLPNLEIPGGVVFGSTMGHHQGEEGFPIQEIYEFHGYGAMVVDMDDKKTADLIVAKPKDKVLIPSFCNMTLYNLDSAPLTTHDFSNPLHNDGTKNLQQKIGPIFCIFFEEGYLKVKLNKEYTSEVSGPRLFLEKFYDRDLEVKLYPYGHGSAGERIHREMTKEYTRERFQRVGIEIKTASETVNLGDVVVDAPLLDFVLKPERHLQKYFQLE